MASLPSPTSLKASIATIGAGGGAAILALNLVERINGRPLPDSWQASLALVLSGYLGAALYRWGYATIYRKATEK